MNILLIFFALPIATIIISIALQKILKSPVLVAAIIFAIFLVVTFVIDNLEFLIATIVYAIISFITAVIVCLIHRFIRHNNNNDDNHNNDNETINNSNTSINSTVSDASNNVLNTSVLNETPRVNDSNYNYWTNNNCTNQSDFNARTNVISSSNIGNDNYRYSYQRCRR